MKMSKASEQDMNSALTLCTLLNQVEDGYYPGTEDDGNLFFDPDNYTHLRVFYDQAMACLRAAPGGIVRVVAGMHTILHNEILDPDADTLELHPRLISDTSNK